MADPMDVPRGTRVGDVLADALERPGPLRDEYVRQACAGDAELEAEVQGLLRAAHDAERLLSGADVGAEAPLAGEVPGAVIGRYRLLKRIGEGGFGAVFLAEQREPVQRRVALKVIKLGMDTRQVIARFEAERQALALMDHPNIATVLDAGATDSGRPYFVMELVRGDPITEYCDTNNLDVAQRLELFQRVCHAVQHAHQKGIIHRDIKPSNVLVTVSDGRPLPKVIDFGIAKATSGRLTEKTLYTEQRALIGTPAYMSPEQADPSGEDIDTRSDVYALGVLLYELLTGTTPFDPHELQRAGFGEIQRIIREVEPPKPSTRLSALRATATSVAARRRTEPARLRGLLRGDLDWIVMRCLEKDRTRRYETASGLAEDVQRHLAGEPVLAAPPSGTYRLRKLIRRNRGPVTAGALILLALVGGLAATMLQAREARRRAGELEQVSAFQAEMLAQVNPTQAGVRLKEETIGRFEAALAALPEDERARRVEAFRRDWGTLNATDAARAVIDWTILKPAVGAVEARFKDQPLIEAYLHQVLADRYVHLGLYAEALPVQARALEIRRRVLGDEHSATLISISGMGAVLREQGKLAEAEPYLREALETRRRMLGDEHPDTLQSLVGMGELFTWKELPAEAEPYLREALEKARRVFGEEHVATLIALNNLGVVIKEQGRLAEAEPYLREAVEKDRRVLGEHHPITLKALQNLGSALSRQQKLSEAEPYCREAVEGLRRTLGESHPDTLGATNNLVFMLSTLGQEAEAEPYMRAVLEASRSVLGEEHPNTLVALANMGRLLRTLKRGREAEPYYREAVEKSRRVLGEDHPETVTLIHGLAALLSDEGDLAGAEPLYREAVERSRRVLGAENKDTLTALNGLGRVLKGLGELSQAEPFLREALETNQRTRGDEHPDTLRSINRLAALHVAQGRFAEAEALLLPAAPLAAALPPEHRAALEIPETLAQLYAAWDAAEPGGVHAAQAAEWRGRSDAAKAAAQKP